VEEHSTKGVKRVIDNTTIVTIPLVYMNIEINSVACSGRKCCIHAGLGRRGVSDAAASGRMMALWAWGQRGFREDDSIVGLGMVPVGSMVLRA
jgi:hypothetical protein